MFGAWYLEQFKPLNQVMITKIIKNMLGARYLEHYKPLNQAMFT